jgi:hypothetical protein
MLAGTQKLQPVLRRSRQIRQNFGIVRENHRREIAFEMKKEVKKDLRVLPRLREVGSRKLRSFNKINSWDIQQELMCQFWSGGTNSATNYVEECISIVRR